MYNLITNKGTTLWPIDPHFLSRCCTNEEDYSPNLHGLYPSDTLRGFLADASDDENIKNPLTLFQVVPSGRKFEEFGTPRIEPIDQIESSFLRNILGKNNSIIRIDPNGLYPNFECCELFRQCERGNKNKCFNLDVQILILYHEELKKYHYSNQFESYVSKLKELCACYNQTLSPEINEYSLHVESKKEEKKIYVWYKCKYSNLYEYFFPVIHAGHIIAVVMHGQRFPKDLKKNQLFENCRYSLTEKGEKLDNVIDGLPSYLFGHPSMSDEREKAIYDRIYSLEKRIDNAVYQIAREKVSHDFREIENVFRNHISTNIQQSHNKRITIESYSKALNLALSKICDVFNPDGFIRIYALENQIEISKKGHLYFYLIGNSKSEIDQPQLFDKIILKDVNEDSLNKIEGHELAEKSVNPIPFKSESDILRIQDLYIGGMKNLIWKRYSTWKSLYERQYTIYSEALKSMYHALLEPYNILKGVDLQDKLEMSMQVSVHEAGNIISTIYKTLSAEYGFQSQTLERIRDGASIVEVKRRERTLYDAIQRLLLLDKLYRRATIIFKELDPEYSWIDLHRLVYSVKSLFDEEAQKSHKQQIIINMDPELDKYDIYAEKSYIDHILFNIVDNAVKYGLRGSNIYIKVAIPEAKEQSLSRKELEQIDKISISVTNFSFEINKDIENRIFDFGFRSSDSYGSEGRGIGLFLVKKLCNSISYGIKLEKSKKISDMYIPTAFFYKSQNPDFKNDEKPTLNKKLLQEVAFEDYVTNKNGEWKIGRYELESALKGSTFENCFTLTVTKQENKNLLKLRT